MFDVQESLEHQTVEFNRKEDGFKKREQGLKKKDLELQASAFAIIGHQGIFLIGGLAIRRVVVDFHAIRGGHLITVMSGFAIARRNNAPPASC